MFDIFKNCPNVDPIAKFKVITKTKEVPIDYNEVCDEKTS